MQVGSFGFQQQVNAKKKNHPPILWASGSSNQKSYRLIYRRELWASTTIVMSPSGKERKSKAK
jgi:hypothetical protein